MPSKPWKHQAATIEFFSERPVGFDFSDPGTGKTRSALAVYLRRKPRGRLLVVCPKTLMRSAWVDDIHKFAPELSVALAYSPDREAAFRMQSDVVIINTDGVKWLAAKANVALLKGFDHLIVDEISAFKHATSQRSKALRQLSKLFTHRYGLTGTPNPISVTELWHPAMIVDGGERLGQSFFHFRNAVQTPTQVGPRPNMVAWHDKPGAQQAVSELLSDISVRHAFEDVMQHVPANYRETKQFVLSARCKAAYQKMLTSAILQLQDGTVNAVHAAALRTKLLQIACLGAETEVLTRRGWAPIKTVTAHDQVWDGDTWVATKGCIYAGDKPVVECFGITMTPDHKVLTTAGWHTAQEILDANANARLDRAAVRLPDGITPSRTNFVWLHAVADAMRLRTPMRAQESELALAVAYDDAFVRLPTGGGVNSCQRYPRQNAPSTIQPLDKDTFSVYVQMRQGLAQLRSAWHRIVSALARLPEVLGRYGSWLQTWVDIGAHQQQPGVFAKQLSLGDNSRAEQSHAQFSARMDAKRTYDYCTRRTPHRHQASNSVSSILHRRSRQTIAATYDVVDAGPRHRFTVRGNGGTPFIVHNSGAVYDGSGNYLLIDRGRYELIVDLITEREHSIVFFNWRHQRDELVAELRHQHVAHAVIDGDTPQRERDEIVKAFQDGKYQALLLHPRTGAHGLTLTRGTTTIISSPIYEADLLKQAIHRIYRGGQTHTTNTILVCATGTVEERVYALLDEKYARMTDLLDLLEDSHEKG